MRIAVDAMGGDLAPGAAVRGARAAVEKDPDLAVALVGDREALNGELASLLNHPALHWVQAEEIIEPSEAPVQAVRHKAESSLVKCIRLVKNHEAEAAISAGNTGALMAAGLFVLGRMRGIERPALTAILPSLKGWGVLMLDVGANLDPRAHQLYQYGVMGSIYCREVYGIDQPRVALLNVGVEEEKGPAVIREAHQLLKHDPGLNFVGNLEPRELLQGHADVVVTEGFAGNVALKAIEGAARDIFREVKSALLGGVRQKVGALLVKEGFSALRRRWDYQETGGAPLLGLNQIVYKCHGSSDARAFQSTILTAAGYCRRGSQTRIEERIQEGAEG
ncbi:phosphate acyltransferase PlsX [Sulfobacillus harzensis]|uniref:phosphate acyltransferase PlsX n=1 Tax=Sulfobacillus harzensis TaxID=2729629 RepID=UPI001A9B6082|nr:phosphate acyltransferase PlsX [Sulfobacillus harzensis]